MTRSPPTCAGVLPSIALLIAATVAVAADGPTTRPATAPADRIDQLIADLEDKDKWPAAAQELEKIGAPAAVRLAAAGASNKPRTLLTSGLVLSRIGPPAALPLARAWDAGDPTAEIGLAVLGESAAPAIPIALARLRRAEPRDRANAAEVLGDIGPPAAATAEGPLTGLLKADPDELVRGSAARALGKLGLPPGRLIQHLGPALDDRSKHVRDDVVGGLRAAGRQAAPLAARLQAIMLNDGAKGRHHYDAARALGAIGAPVVPAMVELLKGSNTTARRAALEVLTFARHESAPALPTIVRLLGHADPDIRQDAACAIGKMGKAARPAVLPLSAQLVDPVLDVRRTAANGLQDLGPVAADAVPALRVALRDPDGQMQVNVLRALRHIGPAAAAAVPDVLPILDAAFARPPATAPATTRAAGGDAVVRPAPEDAVRTLSQMGPTAARAAGERLLRLARGEGGEALKRTALVALRDLGPAAAAARPDAVPTLQGLIDRPDGGLAIQALAAFGPPARPAVPAIAAALGGADDARAVDAALALKELGAADAASLAALDAAARRPEPVLRLVATASAAYLRGDRAGAARTCAAGLNDSKTAFHAAAFLAPMGPDAAVAVPELLAAAARRDLKLWLISAAAKGALLELAAVDPRARAWAEAALDDPEPGNRFLAHERLADLPATRPAATRPATTTAPSVR